jgi:chromosome segregation ATPase
MAAVSKKKVGYNTTNQVLNNTKNMAQYDILSEISSGYRWLVLDDVCAAVSWAQKALLDLRDELSKKANELDKVNLEYAQAVKDKQASALYAKELEKKVTKIGEAYQYEADRNKSCTIEINRLSSLLEAMEQDRVLLANEYNKLHEHNAEAVANNQKKLEDKLLASQSDNTCLRERLEVAERDNAKLSESHTKLRECLNNLFDIIGNYKQENE